jgi:hypothetical protein
MLRLFSRRALKRPENDRRASAAPADAQAANATANAQTKRIPNLLVHCAPES